MINTIAILEALAAAGLVTWIVWMYVTWRTRTERSSALRRITAAAKVLTGKADAVPLALVATPTRDPVEHRPDPTAHLNVFRVLRDALVLNDLQRYSGNDLEKAADALRSYLAAPGWQGTVYVYLDTKQLKAVTR